MGRILAIYHGRLLLVGSGQVRTLENGPVVLFAQLCEVNEAVKEAVTDARQLYDVWLPR